MKKLFIIAVALILAGSTFAFSQEYEKTEGQWANISYYNIPILKIFEAREGYVVIYQKNNVGTGSTVIPKAWAKGNEENPRKLKFRPTTGTLTPFMSVVKKDGEFLRVILTVPTRRTDAVWGVIEYRSKGLEGADKETLEDLPLY